MKMTDLSSISEGSDKTLYCYTEKHIENITKEWAGEYGFFLSNGICTNLCEREGKGMVKCQVQNLVSNLGRLSQNHHAVHKLEC